MDIELTRVPVPRDLPLPLPIPEEMLQVLLVIFFLLHILFVNLMVGGSILVVVFELLGRANKKWDEISYIISKTVTVNKSMAVVMGIGPLLCINLLYTMQWYSANSLTGHAWLLIVPLTITAFLLTYVHKYTWHIWNEGRSKLVHISIGIFALLFFLSIPFIFLSNINLMLFPESWPQVRGFISTLFVGNVFPRYQHFLFASIAVTALFMAGINRFQAFGIDHVTSFKSAELYRLFYRITADFTLVQFIAGPLLFLTLPSRGVSYLLAWVIAFGASLGVVVLYLLRREIKSSDDAIGKYFWKITFVLSLVVLSMGSGRAIYRKTILNPHKLAIKNKTETFEKNLVEFNNKLLVAPADQKDEGEKLFASCAGCHAVSTRLVGPPLTEIAQIYKDSPSGIVKWAKAPGKKRPDYPPMPSFGHMSEEDLLKVANYILKKSSESK